MALGVVVALGAIAVLGVNLYIQSAATQARIQRALSRTLGMPAKITSTSFMPWHGVKLTGLVAQDPDSPAGDNMLEVAGVSARLRLSKLLFRKVVIKELTIDGAKVSWNQTAEGKWLLPKHRRSAGETPPVAPAPPAQPPPETPPAPQPPVEPQPPEPRVAPPEVTVNHFRLRDAEFSLYDKRHKRIAAITGLNVQAPTPTPESVSGSAWVSRVTIQEIFSLENWWSDFRYSPTGLSLFNSRATFAGGVATGSLIVKNTEPDSPFDTSVKFSGVDLGRMIAEAGVPMVRASGFLSGFLRLRGNLRDSNAAEGSGQIALANGWIEQTEFFQEIGQILRTNKLQPLDLEQAEADYHIAGGKILIDQLLLKTPDLALSSQGMMDMSGNLFLKSRLTLEAGFAKVIPSFLLKNFTQDAATGSRSIDFNIFGKISSLKTDLHKQMGLDLKNIWKNWFGGKQ